MYRTCWTCTYIWHMHELHCWMTIYTNFLCISCIFLPTRWWTRKGQNILEILVIWNDAIAKLPLSALCWTHWYIYIYMCVCVCVFMYVCIMHGKYGQYSEKPRQGRWPAEQQSGPVMPYTKEKKTNRIFDAVKNICITMLITITIWNKMAGLFKEDD
jgi:hypothetical protein